MKITKFLGICVVLLTGGLVSPSAEAKWWKQAWEILTNADDYIMHWLAKASTPDLDIIRRPQGPGYIEIGERIVTPSGIDLDNPPEIDHEKMSEYTKALKENLGNPLQMDQQLIEGLDGSNSRQGGYSSERRDFSQDHKWLLTLGGHILIRQGRNEAGRMIRRGGTDESSTSHVQECVPDSLERESGSVAHFNEVSEKLGWEVTLSRQDLSKPEDLTDFVQRQWPMEEQRLELHDPVKELSVMDYVCMQPMSEQMP